MLQEFRNFLFRGNVIDLAVAVVIGAAFSAVVGALVKDLLTPLIAAIVGKPDFSRLVFTVHHSQFAYGDFLDAAISFVLMAAAVFYLVVLPMTMFRRPAAPAPAPQTKQCAECCSEIPLEAKRCKFCTAQI